uniref:Uncharacterized protein n=1 Tax=Arion vulgaris TaxID=1028688 RepID=A0A0B6ZYI6_9EUPU
MCVNDEYIFVTNIESHFETAISCVSDLFCGKNVENIYTLLCVNSVWKMHLGD